MPTRGSPSPNCSAVVVLVVLAAGPGPAQEPAASAKAPSASPSAAAAHEAYEELIPGTGVKFRMAAIPGGSFLIGSPESEKGRRPDEGPQRRIELAPFWMGVHEVTWDEYDLWYHDLDRKRREAAKSSASTADLVADAVTRPSKPYTDMTFGMGHDGYPAICMTQHAAKTYCEWLSAKTGKFYRLPTEAEWEYACRAGTTTAFGFGDDPGQLGDYAWFSGNAEDKTQKVGTKKPNRFGLHDMHGNVMEWTLDEYAEERWATLPADQVTKNPLCRPADEYPVVVRGGSWKQKALRCRSAVRVASDPVWKMQDPQIPQSRWYFTDALFVGFRVVRPLVPPSAEDATKYR